MHTSNTFKWQSVIMKADIPPLFWYSGFRITRPLRTWQLQKMAETVQKTVTPPRHPLAWPHPCHPTLGEKYKESLVHEHRDLSDTALYHGFLPLSHTRTGMLPSSQSSSFSPLTFSEPPGPWHDAQTTHCAAGHTSHKYTASTRWQITAEQFTL